MGLLAVIRPTVLVVDVSAIDDGTASLITRVRALLSKRGGEVPALAWAASTEAWSELMEAGFQDWLPKPCDPIDFLSAIARLTNRVGPDGVLPGE
jgi:DNA-binding response OmpR family regulator